MTSIATYRQTFLRTSRTRLGADENPPSVPDTETDLRNLGFDSAEIDRRLNYLATLNLPAGTDIYIFGNEAPTSASADAINTLLLTGVNTYDNEP